MNTVNFPSRGHSADVQMELSVNGFNLLIGQLGPDFLILRNPTDHPPSIAEIAVRIDGDERRWNVFLPDGISAESKITKTLLPA